MVTDKQNLLNEMQSRINEFFRSTPLGDVERNVKALVTQTFQKMDLVTHDEFQIQGELIDQLRQRVAELEAVVQRLERQSAPAATADSTSAVGPASGSFTG